MRGTIGCISIFKSLHIVKSLREYLDCDLVTPSLFLSATVYQSHPPYSNSWKAKLVSFITICTNYIAISCPYREYPIKLSRIQANTRLPFSVWNLFLKASSSFSICLKIFLAMARGCFMILRERMSGMEATVMKIVSKMSG